jgi:hypothetical protein
MITLNPSEAANRRANRHEQYSRIDDNRDAAIMRTLVGAWSRERHENGQWFRATFGMSPAEAREIHS